MRAPLICTLGWVAIFAAAATANEVHFAEMLERSGINYRNVSGDPEKQFVSGSLGSGAALFDYDLDGDLDLYLVNGALMKGRQILYNFPNRLYRNMGDWRFHEVTEEAGVGNRGWGVGCAVGDIDNDGFPDLYVTNLGPNVLYRNRGDGTFADVTEQARVGDGAWGAGSAFFDADADGFLDLYVANYLDVDPTKLPLPGAQPNCLWFGLDVFCGPAGLPGAADVCFHNNKDGSFSEATRSAFASTELTGRGLGVVAGDIDDDGDIDLYVANDSVPNFLLLNDGSGQFSETGLFSGLAYNAEGLAQAGMGVDMGDLDGDGRTDLFVTNFSHDTNTVYLNSGAGVFTDATARLGLRRSSWFHLGWATRIVDLDNDGDQDLFVANGHIYPEVDRSDLQSSYGQKNQIFWNQEGRRFTEAEFPSGDAMEEIASSRGGAFGDLDDDGDMDIVMVNIDDVPSLLRNELPGGGNWLVVRLVGTESNRDAMGARVTVVAGGGEMRQIKEAHPSGSYVSSSDPRVHFGLGRLTQVELLEVRWPNGQKQSLRNLPANQFLTIVEGR